LSPVFIMLYSVGQTPIHIADATRAGTPCLAMRSSE
jgi:hypothetical protein